MRSVANKAGQLAGQTTLKREKQMALKVRGIRTPFAANDLPSDVSETTEVSVCIRATVEVFWNFIR